MKEYINILSEAQLFSQMTEKEILIAVDCIGAKIKRYKNGEQILRVGDTIRSLGMIAEGNAVISRDDFWGNSSVIAKLAPPQFFGVSYALSSSGESEVNVIAEKDTKVIYFDVNKILNPSSSEYAVHNKIVKNLVTILSNKNIQLSNKIDHISQRKLRDKILSYLSGISQKKKSHSFNIPFSRQQLADYLCADRSALSNELCKLRDDGVIDFKKNH